MFTSKALVALFVCVACPLLDANRRPTLIDNIVDDALKQASTNDRIRYLFEQFRPVLKSGLAEIGLQSLDPLYVDRFDINLLDHYITMKGVASNLMIRDNSDYVIQHMRYEAPVLDMQLLFPNLRVEGDYEGELYGKKLMPVSGKGTFSMELYSLTVNMRVVTKFDDPNIPVLDIDSLRILPRVKSVKTNFRGITGDDQLDDAINVILSQAIPKKLTPLWSVAEKSIMRPLKAMIKEKLTTVSSNKLSRIQEIFQPKM